MYPYWTILVAVLLPYIWATVAMYFKKKQLGSIDLKLPRKQTDLLEGAGYRANAAQSNSWEALAVYTACFLTAVSAGVEPDKIFIPALLWVGFRIMHGITYIADVAPLRMLGFVGGMACNVLILSNLL